LRTHMDSVMFEWDLTRAVTDADGELVQARNSLRL